MKFRFLVVLSTCTKFDEFTRNSKNLLENRNRMNLDFWLLLSFLLLFVADKFSFCRNSGFWILMEIFCKARCWVLAAPRRAFITGAAAVRNVCALGVTVCSFDWWSRGQGFDSHREKSCFAFIPQAFDWHFESLITYLITPTQISGIRAPFNNKILQKNTLNLGMNVYECFSKETDGYPLLLAKSN